MKMKKVVSSQIDEVGYDSKTSILYIKFHNKALYKYFNVPEEVYNTLISTEGVTQYFMENIKTNYKYEKYKS